LAYKLHDMNTLADLPASIGIALNGYKTFQCWGACILLAFNLCTRFHITAD